MEIKRCYDTLIGASVVENQLCNGESVTVPNGHKYYLKKNGSESLGASTGTAITGLTAGTDMVIDLTQELGTAIADYAYSLGFGGIAWLRSYGFLGGYKAYNSGSIESVEVTEKKCVGFNQWDEEFVNGFFNDNGVYTARADILGSKNAIRVLPNTTYCFKGKASAFVTFWRSAVTISDAPSSEFISRLQMNSDVSTFTTPSGCHYIFFNMPTAYGTTYNHDICINLSNPDRNGEYEAYAEQTYDYGDDTLNGIFKLDANNNLYADGDRKEADGTITRKYDVVDLGTLNWTKSGNPQRFEGSAIPNAKAPATTYTIPDIMTDIYMPTYSSDGSSDRVIALNINGEPRIYDSAKYQSMSASEFKTAMNGVMCVYELATPTTEQSTPFTSPQICYPDGTEEFVTENGVPVGHESKYQL